ncbi:MAG: hypothetical protein ACN4GR_17345 [Arenicellales bacterium]
MAERKNLEPIHAGSDVEFELTFVDKKGEAIPVAGDKLYMTIKSDLSLADGAAEMQVSYTILPGDDATAGVAYLPLSNTETDIDPARYHYDVTWIRAASGADEVVPAWYGEVTVLQRATRAKA